MRPAVVATVVAVACAGRGVHRRPRRPGRARHRSGGIGHASLASIRGPRPGRRRSPSSAEGLRRLRTALATGWSLAGALEALAAAEGPWAVEAAAVVGDRRPGEPLQAALDRWAERDPAAEVRALADAVAVAGATGASLPSAVEVAVAVVDERRAADGEVRAATAPHRASAMVLTAVPVAFAVVVAAIEPRVARFTVATPLGWSCLAAGVVLDAIGGWWLVRLVRSV